MHLARCPTDGSALVDAEELATDPLVGRLIAGRYRLLAPLGRGGMGVVYRAEHVAMRKPVAVKVLRAELSSDPGAVARFQREAQAASRIVSPHVIELFDFGQDGELLFMSMELLTGKSLAQMLRDGPIAPREAVRIGTAVARGLAAAHEAGVVHRDLKPDNIFIEVPLGSVKVLDFGIAKIAEGSVELEGAGLTQAGSIVGTPYYMSPEAAAHRPVGPAGDLYSFGIVLYEMLVGTPPFVDDEIVLILGLHLRAPPELVREARPELVVPDALEELIDRLLEKKPDDRPASAGATGDALELIASRWDEARAAPPPAEVDAEPTAVGERPVFASLPAASKASGRAVRWLALSIVGAGVVAAGAAAALFVGQRAEPEQPITSAPPNATAPESIEIRLSNPSPPETILEWDGRRIEAGTHTVPRDARAHELHASAPGYQPLRVEVIADATQTIPIVLVAQAPIAQPAPVGPSPGEEPPARSPTERRPPGSGRVRRPDRGPLDLVREYQQ